MKQELVKYELEKKRALGQMGAGKKRNWSNGSCKKNSNGSNASLKNRRKKGTGQMEVGKQHNKNWSKFKGSWKKKKKTGIIKWELNGNGGKKEEKKN